MARPTLDAESLQRDRQRYQGFLEQAERQLASCQERIERLQQAIEAIDQLAGLIEADGPANRAASPVASQTPPGAQATRPPRRPPAPKAKRARAAGGAPSPTSTPAAPDPVAPPAGSAAGGAGGDAAPGPPKGTEALRVILDSEPGRAWSLAELLDALGSRGWLPASRRPEEGVRISLKRLVERGGAVRVDNGRWRSGATGSVGQALPSAGAPVPGEGVQRANGPEPVEGPEPVGATEPATPQAARPEPEPRLEPGVQGAADPEEPHPQAAAGSEPEPEPRAEPSPPPTPTPPARRSILLPTSFGRPVGGSITEL